MKSWNFHVVWVSLLLLVFVFSCGSRRSFKEKIILENTNRLDTISVDYDNKRVLASEIIDDYKIVYLKTGGLLIGTISKLLFSDDHIYIADYPGDKVYCFDLLGKMKFYIAAQGNAPGEYTKIKDVGVNKKQGVIEILDTSDQSILQYDMYSGEFIQKERFDFWTKSAAPLPNGNRIFHQGTMPNGAPIGQPNLDKSLFITNSRNEIIDSYFDLFELGLNKVRLTTLENIFMGSGGEVFFIPLYDNVVYQAEADNIKPKYFVNFRSKIMPDNFLKNFNAHFTDFPHYLHESGYAYSLTDFYSSSSHITLSFSTGQGYYRVVYDKKTRKSITYRSYVRDDRRFAIVPKAVFKEFHVTVVSDESVEQRLNFFIQNAGKFNLNEISEYKVLKQAVDENEDGNPFLVFNKFKAIQ